MSSVINKLSGIIANNNNNYLFIKYQQYTSIHITRVIRLTGKRE